MNYRFLLSFGRGCLLKKVADNIGIIARKYTYNGMNFKVLLLIYIIIIIICSDYPLAHKHDNIVPICIICNNLIFEVICS